MIRRPSYDQFVQRRIKTLLILFAVLCLLLGARLFHIQVVLSSQFRGKTLRKIELLARRGTVYDRNGNKLAFSVEGYEIYVQPARITDKAGTADVLAPIIGWDRQKLLARLNVRRPFVYLTRRAKARIGVKVKEAKLPGVGAIPKMIRVYPGGELAAHVVGFTDIDGRGLEGVEKTHDEYLRGTDGCVLAEVDALGVVIPGTERKRVEPVDGMDVVLTIDGTVQHALETHLARSFNDHSAAGAAAVVLDPKTGEILALANMPTFDLNHVGRCPAEARRNRAITDMYEPGSTLKTITACAALEEKAVDTNDKFYCHGSMRVGKRTIQCSLHAPFLNGHGACDLAKILRYSCNIGAASVGLKLGREKLYRYEEAFGLYDRPGTDMPGEVCGWHDNWRHWQDVRLANIAFGQGIAVTPLQLATAYAAVANGGVLMRPYIVKEIRRHDGTPEKVFGPHMVRRVVSEETAGIVAGMLHGAVTGGTGKSARVDGYQIAGKTGSAQKASTTSRGYAAGKFVASFVGFLPISDPRVTILVAVDEPKGTHWGATVAAPVFREVARTAMWHMKVPPDEPVQPPSSVARKAGGRRAEGASRPITQCGRLRG